MEDKKTLSLIDRISHLPVREEGWISRAATLEIINTDTSEIEQSSDVNFTIKENELYNKPSEISDTEVLEGAYSSTYEQMEFWKGRYLELKRQHKPVVNKQSDCDCVDGHRADCEKWG